MKGSSLQYRQRLTEWCMCACVRVQPLLVREPSFINMYILLIFLCFSGRKKRRKKKILGEFFIIFSIAKYTAILSKELCTCVNAFFYILSAECVAIFTSIIFFSFPFFLPCSFLSCLKKTNKTYGVYRVVIPGWYCRLLHHFDLD